jgi:hypothetical protein
VVRVVGREVARAMARVVEVVRARARTVALAPCCIWRVIPALVVPARGGAWENGLELRPPLRRVVADVIILLATGSHD